MAAAKRELIEGLPRDGVAVLNGDDARVLRFRDWPSGPHGDVRILERADVRAEARRFAPEARASGRGSGFRNRRCGAARGDEPAGGDRRGARVSESRRSVCASRCEASPSARCEGNGWNTTESLVWDDCYNSNPEAAQSMIDVLRETPAARRIAVLGEMLELGHARRSAAPPGGEICGRARGRSADRRAAAPRSVMVEAAVDAGLPRSAAFFGEAGEAGDFAARSRSPAMRSCSRARAGSAWSGRWRNFWA